MLNTQEENQIEKYLSFSLRHILCVERVNINYHVCKKKIKFRRIDPSFFHFVEIL